MYESPPTTTMSNADPPPTLIQNDPNETESSQAGPMTGTEMPDRPSEGSSGEMMESLETRRVQRVLSCRPHRQCTDSPVRNFEMSSPTRLELTFRIPDDLEPDTPLHGYASIGAGELTISARAVEQYESAAQTILENFLSRSGERSRYFDCPDPTADENCLSDGIERLGRQL